VPENRSRGSSARVADENGLTDARTSRQGWSSDVQNGGWPLSLCRSVVIGPRDDPP
jgi:hypothetical protein